MDLKQQKEQEVFNYFYQSCTNIEIQSDIDFDYEQLSYLFNLNEHCVSQSLKDIEVLRDPRKLSYKSIQSMHLALVAICLANALVNPNRRRWENKQYFYDNITISTPQKGIRQISFGKIARIDVLNAIYPEIIEDWIIYSDKEGLGIKGLIDEKTNLIGLDNFQRGGDAVSEFARFKRKYQERQSKKEEKARESAQTAFRNAVTQSLANKVVEQQLLEGKNINDLMLMVEDLFDPSKAKKQKTRPKMIETSAEEKKIQSLLLEHFPEDN